MLRAFVLHITKKRKQRRGSDVVFFLCEMIFENQLSDYARFAVFFATFFTAFFATFLTAFLATFLATFLTAFFATFFTAIEFFYYTNLRALVIFLITTIDLYSLYISMTLLHIRTIVSITKCVDNFYFYCFVFMQMRRVCTNSFYLSYCSH